MQPSTFLLGTLLVFAMFSGCLDQGESVQLSSRDVPAETTNRPASPGIGASPSPTPPSDTMGPPPPAPEPEPPRAAKKPVANLTVDAPNGSIPYSPTFTIGDSARGEGNYNWTIDFGEGNSTNGTGLPVAVSHNYTEVGEYIVNVTVENEAGTSNASINVTANDFARQRFSGTWKNGLGACTVGPSSDWRMASANKTTHVQFPINNTTWGLPFSVEFDAEDASSWKVDFYDKGNKLVASQDSTDIPFVNGTVPTSASIVVIWACNMSGGGGSAEYASAEPEEWERQRQAERAEE